VRTQFDRSGDRIIKTSGELPLLAELRAFVGHLNGGPPPKSSALEGAEMVERIAQVIEMAESLR
jgi:hypothetical protein